MCSLSWFALTVLCWAHGQEEVLGQNLMGQGMDSRGDAVIVSLGVSKDPPYRTLHMVGLVQYRTFDIRMSNTNVI